MPIQYHLAALFCATVLPAALFASRSVLRAQRSAVYNDIIASLFPEDHLPQLELIAGKYGARQRPKGDYYLANANRDPIATLVSAMLFVAVSMCGFELLLLPAGPFLTSLLSGETPSQPTATDALAATLAVGGAGFLGSYVASTRNLIRQSLNFELDGMSFTRATVLALISVIVTIVIFRALQPGLHSLQNGLAGALKSDAKSPEPYSPGMWLGTAFLIGMAPEAGVTFLTRRLKLSFLKTVNIDVYRDAQVIPIEIVDGIDAQVAYRLEENNIEDVQNLATASPISLYIETPYGLFEVFDWVLQAQLCLVFGVKTFFALKDHGIRTIFDLERAVLSDGVPDAYVQAIGAVIFADASEDFLQRIGVKDGASISADIVRHAVAVTGDDLHIHRLRTLWLQIQRRSWPDSHRSEWIYRRSPLPGDPGYGQATPQPAA